MRHRLIPVFFLMLLTLSASLSFAQPKPMKWGSVPIEDLKMTGYAADSNALAVVLGEYGEYEMGPNAEVIVDYHIRVKLLSETAYNDWATVVLTQYKDARYRNIEGHTIVLDGRGKKVKHKLGKKSVFKEKVSDDVERIRFTLPALEPGAVIEYRYKYIANSNVILPEWTFQHSEPTRWSELRTNISHYYHYVSIGTVRQYHIREESETTFDGYSAKIDRWVLKDVPALREEPFITTMKDYRKKLILQLSHYYTNSGFTSYLRTWPELAADLRGRSYFGKATRGQKLKQLTSMVTDRYATPDEKVRAIHTYVRKNHVWNGESRLWPDGGLDDILKTPSVSNAGQALIMISMLREAGFDANPVLISTREHGRAKQTYPVLNQFDYLITHAKWGDQSFLLDATQPNVPYSMLPEDALNSVGWMVTASDNEWIPVKPKVKHQQLNSLAGRLNEDGSVTFSLNSSSAGYKALEMRDEFHEMEDDEFVRTHVLVEEDLYSLSDIQYAGIDSLEKTIQVKANLHVDQLGMQAGEMIYFNPHLITDFGDNPFKAEKRTLPVDFGFPRDYVFSMRLELPDSYEVVELPADLSFRLPLKGGAFRRSIQRQGNTLILQSRFTISQATYTPDRYQDLKMMFDRVIAAQSDQIVLRQVSLASNN